MLLDNIANVKDSLSCYIHIPFCSKKCSYCAFFSQCGISSEQQNAYVEKLCSEIEQVCSVYSAPFETIFIGGGNPGLLSFENLEKLCSSLVVNGKPKEFSVEMNPENIRDDIFPLFDKYFTRLSAGIQSLDEKALQFLGRNSSLEQTKNGIAKALEIRKRYGTSLNFDLICCLPSSYDSRKDLESVLKFNPDHISLYALTPEENTLMYEKRFLLPDQDRQYEILSSLWAVLNENGYEHYEVSNFAKKGHRCLHNERYWSYESYVGLGCAAAGTLIVPFSNGSEKAFRYEAKQDISQYICLPDFSTYIEYELSETERKEELILMGVRHSGGVDLKRAGGVELFKDVISSLDGFHLKNGYLIPDESALMTSDCAAQLLVDSII